MKKITRLRGMRDILPDEAEEFIRLFHLAYGILKTYGFRFIIPPTLEDTRLFVRSIGETTDIVEKEMYSFLDRGGKSLTLRPEGTASVVRAYIENNMIPPIKLAYFLNNFRHERPQKGRFREHWQIGVEIIGLSDPMVDAELVELGKIILEKAGLPKIKIEINSIGTPEERKKYSKVLKSSLKKSIYTLCANCRRRFEGNTFRILDCKEDQDKLEDIPLIIDSLSKESREFFESVKRYLNNWGVEYTINTRLVRGLDYYTHTVFEFKAGGLGAKDSVGGGGRYDGLVEELGGKPTKACGFSLGVDRIILALDKRREPNRVDFFVVTVTERERDYGIVLLRKLRERGISAEFSYDIKSLRSQMKLADRIGAKKVVIIGEEEINKDSLRIRDMTTGEEKVVKEEVFFKDIIKWI